MNLFHIFGIFVIFTGFCSFGESANIVGIYPLDMKSHYLIAQNFLKELAKDGHNVTVFTGFKSNNLPKNYREVMVKVPSLDGMFFE